MHNLNMSLDVARPSRSVLMVAVIIGIMTIVSQWAVAQIENKTHISGDWMRGFIDGKSDAQTGKTSSCNDGNESAYCIGYCEGLGSLAKEMAKDDPGILAGGYGCKQ
jgi:hypothetical protein